MKLIKLLLGSKVDSSDEAIEKATGDIAAFEQAMAAIDRAAAERQRSTVADRRKGGPDTRPLGSPERRAERRGSTAFGRRGS